MPWEADQPGAAVTLIHLRQHHRAGAGGAVCSPPQTDRSEPTESQAGWQCGANREDSAVLSSFTEALLGKETDRSWVRSQ